MIAATASPSVQSRGQCFARTLLAALSSERCQVGLLLASALLVRLALHFRSPALVAKDSQSYYLPGWEIAHGLPLELGQRRVPGYPGFVALAIILLGEDLRSLALAQHLLGVATVAVTYLIGRLTFGRAAGLLTGLLVALDGPLLIYERYVLSESLFTLVLALSALAAVLASRRSTWRRWLVVGVTLGLAILTRPIAQTLIPLFAVSVLLAPAPRRLARLYGLMALAAGLVTVQGPWVIRNALEKGNPGASTFGRTLIARTAYYDRGFIFDPPGDSHPDPLIQSARTRVQDLARQQQSDGAIAGRLREEFDLDPVEVNRVMRDVAVDAIRRNPIHFLTGTLQFAWRIFQGQEERLREHWDEYKDVNPWDQRVWPLVGAPTPAEQAERTTAAALTRLYQPNRHATALAVLSSVGLLMAFGHGRRAGLVPAAIAVCLVVISAALDGPVERYRYPVDPFISLLASGGAFGLIQHLRRPLRPSLAPTSN